MKQDQKYEKLSRKLPIEEDFANIQKQSLHEYHILDLCHIAAMNPSDRIGEVEKKSELLTKVIQGLKKTFMNFL